MFSDEVLFFDIETDSVEVMWDQRPEDFWRIGGYAWGMNGDVILTTDREEMIHQIESAKVSVAFNGHAFDWSVIYGKDSTRPLELALEQRLWDPMTHATLHHPAPLNYTDRDGRLRWPDKPEKAKHWFSLDNQAYQLGFPGKLSDLKDLAKKYGGFGEIPLDDEDYLAYLEQDVIALRTISVELMRRSGGMSDYDWREQLNAAIDAQNSRNGWRIDQEMAQARVDELERIKQEHLTLLNEKFGLPKEGKAPLRTNAGKQAILDALASVGIDQSELPRTKDKNKQDTDRPSLGSKGILAAAKGKGKRAEELAFSIGVIGGLRPLAQQALDYVKSDGRVHPSVMTLQRSGRKSTQYPGLTTWTSRGPNAWEKSYFLPDYDTHVLAEFDYSQADARIVAAYSGDEEFAKRFAPGADAHMITAELVWGYDVVHESAETEAHYRQLAKAQNHAYAYRCGPKTLAKTAGVELPISQKFVNEMQSAYRKVTKWQDKVTKEGKRGTVTNDWGRTMIVDKDREYTQAPALYGQSGTRELVVDALIRMARRDIRLITMLKAQVHDALVFSIPREELDYWVPIIKECMNTSWGPSDGSGQVVDFPVSMGPAAENWYLAGH